MIELSSNDPRDYISGFQSTSGAPAYVVYIIVDQ